MPIDSLGTGMVESDPERPIIHFGSPAGSRYGGTMDDGADRTATE